jgi:hypothetical protein
MMRIHAAHSPITDEVCRIYEAHRPPKPPVRLVG